jgi:Cupin domain
VPHLIVDISALPRTAHAHELVGADHGVPVSLILIDCPPGEGPALHRHPYAELFLIESGQGSFHLDGVEVTASGRAARVMARSKCLAMRRQRCRRMFDLE